MILAENDEEWQELVDEYRKSEEESQSKKRGKKKKKKWTEAGFLPDTFARYFENGNKVIEEVATLEEGTDDEEEEGEEEG